MFFRRVFLFLPVLFLFGCAEGPVRFETDIPLYYEDESDRQLVGETLAAMVASKEALNDEALDKYRFLTAKDEKVGVIRADLSSEKTRDFCFSAFPLGDGNEGVNIGYTVDFSCLKGDEAKGNAKQLILPYRIENGQLFLAVPRNFKFEDEEALKIVNLADISGVELSGEKSHGFKIESGDKKRFEQFVSLLVQTSLLEFVSPTELVSYFDEE